MKTFFKFISSLLYLPFLVPWFLADKTFEYLIQSLIIKRHKLVLPRKKIWILRTFKGLVLLLIGVYLLKRILYFSAINENVLSGFKNLNILFMIFYNDFVKAINVVLTPLNHVIFYFSGGVIHFGDFFLSLYLSLLLLIFLSNLLYRLYRTRLLINEAVALRNRAIREVDIAHYAEKAKDEEIFLGLDFLNQDRPFYARRSWLKGHLQVIGGPGSGKTESIVQPIWFQEVRRNVATFVLDGKGSRRNVDKFFTIASSLAQGHEIYYFNPADPGRSDSYNPLRRGTAGEIKNKIMASINWAEHTPAAREKLDLALNVFLRAMEETELHFSLKELLKHFQSREYLEKQVQLVSDHYVKNGLNEILANFGAFQSTVAFFIALLRDLVHSEYADLIDTDSPKIDIIDIYFGRKDCYFTLPMPSGESAGHFLGQLILQDILYCFNYLALRGDHVDVEEGLLIVDEMVKFVSPDFIKLLQASRTVGVSVCYTNQSFAELDNPSLHLSTAFIDQLAEHTNAVCCFQLGSPESIQLMLNRFGLAGSVQEEDPGKGLNLRDPNFLRHLELGKCVVFIRRPRILTVLKTGYFKFEKLFRYSGQREKLPEEDYAYTVNTQV